MPTLGTALVPVITLSDNGNIGTGGTGRVIKLRFADAPAMAFRPSPARRRFDPGAGRSGLVVFLVVLLCRRHVLNLGLLELRDHLDDDLEAGILGGGAVERLELREPVVLG